MRPLLRFFRWLADSIPLYSWRDCCREWNAGREHGMREQGFVRGAGGRFTRVYGVAHVTRSEINDPARLSIE